MICYDIETGPRPAEEIEHMFDPDGVKYGNVKDSAKRRAIDKAALETFFDKAALSPISGRIIAIGYASPGSEQQPSVVGVGYNVHTEEDVLGHFWQTYQLSRERKTTIAGWNSNEFDFPYIIKRSWMLGVEVPSSVYSQNRRYFADHLIDLMKVFLVGSFSVKYAKLEMVAESFGFDKKTPLNGADFHSTWEHSQQEAVRYLQQDALLTASVAERMGVV